MRSRGWRGFAAGLVGGLAAAATMELTALILQVKTLPELVQEPLLGALPGPVFGFLIDNLQHWGKVLEEGALIIAFVLGLAVLGAAAGRLSNVRPAWRWGLLAGGAAWAAVTLVVLPLAGAGLLGLGLGITVPLAWALVFAVYALVWETAAGRPPAAEADPGRRRVAVALPVGIALASLGVLAWTRVPDWLGTALAPPESRLGGPVPEITPVADFYQVSKNFSDPVVPRAGWSLHVGGRVGRALSLSLDELRAIPAVTEAVTLECISNGVGGPLMSTGRFTGVPLRDLLAMTDPQAGSTAVAFHARDGYTESLPLASVMASPEILVAYDLDGAPLPDAHGFPTRILAPGRYGMKGPKWLDRIELTDSTPQGYWEGQGWDPDAPVKTTARFDAPHDSAQLSLAAGTVGLAGVAFAGSRGVRAVEWSADGGRSWAPAGVTPALSRFSWVLWKADWKPAREGVYDLVVRAVDGSGNPQPERALPSYPSGAAGYHRVTVQVGR